MQSITDITNYIDNVSIYKRNKGENIQGSDYLKKKKKFLNYLWMSHKVSKYVSKRQECVWKRFSNCHETTKG